MASRSSRAGISLVEELKRREDRESPSTPHPRKKPSGADYTSDTTVGRDELGHASRNRLPERDRLTKLSFGVSQLFAHDTVLLGDPSLLRPRQATILDTQILQAFCGLVDLSPGRFQEIRRELLNGPWLVRQARFQTRFQTRFLDGHLPQADRFGSDSHKILGKA